jgi:hypothetical protein
MEQRKPFQKINIEQPSKEQKESQERLAQMVDAQMELIDIEVDNAMIDLIRELGYNAERGMTLEETQELHERMKKAGHYIAIETEQEGTTYIVKLQVIQLAKTLRFELGGEKE